jgi:hypothetical protein
MFFRSCGREWSIAYLRVSGPTGSRLPSRRGIDLGAERSVASRERPDELPEELLPFFSDSARRLPGPAMVISAMPCQQDHSKTNEGGPPWRACCRIVCHSWHKARSNDLSKGTGDGDELSNALALSPMTART